MSDRITITQIIARLRTITEKSVNDPEAAHSMEDQLHVDVLRAIAEKKCANPAILASEALQTLKIDFPRWCA